MLLTLAAPLLTAKTGSALSRPNSVRHRGPEDLVIPWPARHNPFIQSAVEETYRLARGFDLLQTEAARKSFQGFAYLAGFAYPTASPQALAACAKLMCWMFFLDDFYDGLSHEGERGHAQHVMETNCAVLTSGRLPSTAVVDSLLLYTQAVHHDLRSLAVGGEAWFR